MGGTHIYKVVGCLSEILKMTPKRYPSLFQVGVEMVRNTISCCNGGCPYSEAVARKIPWNPCSRQNFSQPLCENVA